MTDFYAAKRWCGEFLSRLDTPLRTKATARAAYLRIEPGPFRTRGGEYRSPNLIRLNPEMTDHHARQTFGHELAHALDDWFDAGSGHGPTWGAWMIRLGLEPERYHNHTELLAARDAYRVTCRDCDTISSPVRNLRVCPKCFSPDLKVELL